MKTIAVTIDDETERLLRRLCTASGRTRGRSAMVRAAIQHLAREGLRRQAEEDDRRVVRVNRRRLAREARALVREQAKA
jgi:hypothetical protein